MNYQERLEWAFGKVGGHYRSPYNEAGLRRPENGGNRPHDTEYTQSLRHGFNRYEKQKYYASTNSYRPRTFGFVGDFRYARSRVSPIVRRAFEYRGRLPLSEQPTIGKPLPYVDREHYR